MKQQQQRSKMESLSDAEAMLEEQLTIAKHEAANSTNKVVNANTHLYLATTAKAMQILKLF